MTSGAVRALSPAAGSDDLRLIVRIARMYHDHGMRQVEIAERLHLSQTKVSRMLQKAVDLGVVRTVVSMPAGVHADLEEALERKYGLLEAVVADSYASDGDSLRALAAVAAQHFEATLGNRDVVGISSWSETLLAAVNYMRPVRGANSEAVVQMVGGRGSPRVQVLATGMLERLGTLLNAETHYVLTPAVLGSPQARDELMRDPSMAGIIDIWDRMTVALVGIGALNMSPMLAESGNTQADDDRLELATAGAVGDVCLHYFDEDGHAVHSGFDQRVMAVCADCLKAVPRRVGVAGGLDKLAAVRGAMRGGWINVLVTDAQLATALVEDDKE